MGVKLAAAAVAAGMVFVAVGVALVFLPAGIIAAGAELAAAGLLVDIDRFRGKS